MSKLSKDMTREQWDALTREEQIELVIAAIVAANRLVGRENPTLGYTGHRHPGHRNRLGSCRGETGASRAEYLSVAEPGGSA
jgi:hypothetical protein